MSKDPFSKRLPLLSSHILSHIGVYLGHVAVPLLLQACSFLSSMSSLSKYATDLRNARSHSNSC
jgi:hypothetical protein